MQKENTPDGQVRAKSKSSLYDEHIFLPDLKLSLRLPPEPVGIAEMANLFGVTHRTLHFYEEKGLLSSRRSGLMRIYSHRDVNVMALVNTCREVGIPVAVIQEFMEKLADADSQGEATALFEDLLNNRKRELTADLSTMRRQMQQISNLLAPDDDDDTVQTGPLPEDTIILTDIERKCLELMAEGYASVRLARAVGLRTEELQKIELGIIQKFSANNRFQAVAKAVLLGIIPA